MNTTIIVGGGAAGMMAAYSASISGDKVYLLEKNEKLGKKIYITGKGRCNFTNNCERDEFLNNVSSNPKFLFSALTEFTPKDIIDFLEKNGIKTKEERGRRMFPYSDKASDVTKAFEIALKKSGVIIKLKCNVSKILLENNADCDKFIVKGVILSNGETIYSGKVIIATGGISYKTTGSTGDGYKFAKSMGHSVTELYPSLVGINADESICSLLQGLSLKNVGISLYDNKKILYNDFGEMLFTHFGVSGPIILTLSSLFAKKITEKNLILSIDLKPKISADILDKRLLAQINTSGKKLFKNILPEWMPKSLIRVFEARLPFVKTKYLYELTKPDRLEFIKLLKDFRIMLQNLRSFDEAIITKGGINVREINPKTMESKLVNGVFFAGEVIDVDAMTGGYNLQIAWATGFVSGKK